MNWGAERAAAALKAACICDAYSGAILAGAVLRRCRCSYGELGRNSQPPPPGFDTRWKQLLRRPAALAQSLWLPSNIKHLRASIAPPSPEPLQKANRVDSHSSTFTRIVSGCKRVSRAVSRAYAPWTGILGRAAAAIQPCPSTFQHAGGQSLAGPLQLALLFSPTTASTGRRHHRSLP